MSATFASILLAAACFGQTPPTAADADRAARQAYMKAQAAELALFRGPESKERLTQVAEPVLRYSNAEREIGSLDGLTFLWLAGTRPVAAVSLSVRRVRSEVYRECTSFSAEPLECRAGEAVVWSPKTGGLLRQTLPDAPAPAATKTQRLTQMRDLARRFAATCYDSRSGEPSELRLLTQPLYRFADEKDGLLDGALFAFVVSNDPELFLMLEAVPAAAGGKVIWHYSLARMSSLKEAVRLNDKEIWSASNFYSLKAGERKTSNYLETRSGTYAAPAAAAPADK